MRVEILSLDPSIAHCEVTDGEDTVRFSCSFGNGSYEALQFMIRNAAHALARQRSDRALSLFAQRASTTRVGE